jgi:hypothetical protein
VGALYQCSPALTVWCSVAVNELSAKHYAQCLARIQEHLEMEQEPFTQNSHYLETCKEKWLAYYKDARAGQSATRSAKRARTDSVHPESQGQCSESVGHNHFMLTR